MTKRSESRVPKPMSTLSRRRPHSRRTGMALWLVIGIVTLGACEEQLSPEAFVVNQTRQPIDVYHLIGGSEELVESLDEPIGGSHYQELFGPNWNSSGCTSGDLVARTPEGEEVARLTDQLCWGETWWIEIDGTSTVQNGDD